MKILYWGIVLIVVGTALYFEGYQLTGEAGQTVGTVVNTIMPYSFWAFGAALIVYSLYRGGA